MKNISNIIVACTLALTLALPTNMMAAEPNTAHAQHIVADVFKAHTNDHVRLQVLRDWVENRFRNQDHNWFQRARNMTVQEEQELIQQYADYQEKYDASIEPVRKAIAFLEDKLEFEIRTREAYLHQEWLAEKEAGEEQASLQDKQAEKNRLGTRKVSLKTVALLTGVAGLVVGYGLGLQQGVFDIPFI